jgi:hypothetical protein
MSYTYFTPINADDMLADSMQATAQQKIVDLYATTSDMYAIEDGKLYAIGDDSETEFLGTDSYLYYKRDNTIIKTDVQVIDKDTMQVINTLAYFQELSEIKGNEIEKPIMQAIVTKTLKQLPTFGIDSFIEGFVCIVLP